MAKKSEPQDPKPASPSRKVEPLWLPIDQIIPNAWNPNAQNEATYELLKDEIAENGNLAPIQVVPLGDGTYRIIGGEHRWRASKELGEDEILCVVLKDKKWEEIDLQKFVTVRLNVIHGKLDPDKFLALYKEMVSKYGEESIQRMMGYADSRGFQKMLGWVKKGLKKSLPAEMAEAVEDATKEVKTVADLGNVIQDLFQQYGDTLSSSFMVFTYGKQQHLYITMKAQLRRSMDLVTTYCKETGTDINDLFDKIMLKSIPELNLDLDQAKKAKPSNPDVEVEKVEW